MTKTNKTIKSQPKHWRRGLVIILPVVVYILILGYMMRGKNMAIINPKGFIASQQHTLLIYVILVMLILAVPTITLIYFTAWKYRDTNKRADFEPTRHYSKWLAVTLWLVPASFIALIASMMIPATHRLEPRKALADRPPITIQVVALRWKWLFIYPDQKIATVNYVQVPVNTPVQFELTADDAPMSSFWIPNFGGQLYAMTGHVNRLNLQADVAGDYPGKAAEINGAGFTGMQFITHASDEQAYEQWVRSVQTSPRALDFTSYQELLRPTENNTPAVYALTDKNLYDEIVAKYNSNHSHHE